MNVYIYYFCTTVSILFLSPRLKNSIDSLISVHCTPFMAAPFPEVVSVLKSSIKILLIVNES